MANAIDVNLYNLHLDYSGCYCFGKITREYLYNPGICRFSCISGKRVWYDDPARTPELFQKYYRTGNSNCPCSDYPENIASQKSFEKADIYYQYNK